MTTLNNSPLPDPNQYHDGQPEFEKPHPDAAGHPPPGGFPGQQVYPAPNAPGFVPPPKDMHGASFNGTQDNDIKGQFDFSDQTIRRGFIRKVYSIMMLQIIFSMAIISFMVYHTNTRNYVQNHWGLIVVSFIIVIVALSCCREYKRKSPANLIFLGLITCAESFMLGGLACTFKNDNVVFLSGMCAAVCLGLALFTFQTKWDFTLKGCIIFVAVIILLIYGIVAILDSSRSVLMIFTSLCALLYSIYVIYDTQMIMGGEHKYSISPEEYIFAALTQYLDVITLRVPDGLCGRCSKLLKH